MNFQLDSNVLEDMLGGDIGMDSVERLKRAFYNTDECRALDAVDAWAIVLFVSDVLGNIPCPTCRGTLAEEVLSEIAQFTDFAAENCGHDATEWAPPGHEN